MDGCWGWIGIGSGQHQAAWHQGHVDRVPAGIARISRRMERPTQDQYDHIDARDN